MLPHIDYAGIAPSKNKELKCANADCFVSFVGPFLQQF